MPPMPPACANCTAVCILKRKPRNVCDVCEKGGEGKENLASELEDDGSAGEANVGITAGNHVRIHVKRFGKKWAEGLYGCRWDTEMLGGQTIHFDQGKGVWMCKWQDDPNFYASHPRHLERVDGSKVDDDDLEQLLAGDQRLGWLRDQANYTGTVWRCPMASCDFDVCISCAVGMDKEPRRRLRDRDKKMIDLMCISMM